MAKPMQLRIVCPEECVYEGAVAYVAVPSTVGEFGILPHHASEICTIDGGHIRVSETKMGVVDQLGNMAEGDARRAYLYNEIAWCKLLLAQ